MALINTLLTSYSGNKNLYVCLEQKICTMKHRCLSIIGSAVFSLIMLSAVNVNAQEQQASYEGGMKPKIGVKGGLNLSNFYVDEVDSRNMKPGLNLGLFAKIPVARGFSIQPEILYSSKGSRITYDNVIFGQGEYNYNLNYIELPLLAVINLGRSFNLHAGGYAAYLTSANIKEKEAGINDEVARFNAENFNRFDYGLVGGLGVDVDNFTIGARYNYGLNDIGRSGNLTSTALRNARHSVISLYVGFGF